MNAGLESQTSSYLSEPPRVGREGPSPSKTDQEEEQALPSCEESRSAPCANDDVNPDSLDEGGSLRMDLDRSPNYTTDGTDGLVSPAVRKRKRVPKSPRIRTDFRKNKRGVPFSSQFMVAVYYLFQYFSLEKLFGGPLKSVEKARERVADALRISQRKVTECVRKVQMNAHKTPNKHRSYKKPMTTVDAFTKTAIRNVVYEQSMNGIHVTIATLFDTIRQRKIQFFGSKSSLRRLVLQLGFKFAQVDGRKYLLEKPSIAAKRGTFLQRYMELRKKYKFVWLDETWIFQKGGLKGRSWQDVNVRSCPVRGVSNGKRYIVLHAGGEDGWIDGCSLVFASGSSKGDYHGEMNGKNFMSWWYKLLDNLHEPTVIVMDNASYHTTQIEPQPTSAWGKAQLMKWLTDNNIEYPEGMLRPHLLELARKNRKPPLYLADEEARKRGHIVLRLPPYHCHYNPIELAWGIMKRHYDKNINRYGKFTEEKCFNEWNKAISKVTPAVWRKIVNKVDKLIVADWINEGGLNDVDKTDYSKMAFSVDSSSESDEEFVDDFGLLPEDNAAEDRSPRPPESEQKCSSEAEGKWAQPSESSQSLPQSSNTGNNETSSVQGFRRALFVKKEQVVEPEIDLSVLHAMESAKLPIEVHYDDEIVAEGFKYKVENEDIQTLNFSERLTPLDDDEREPLVEEIDLRESDEVWAASLHPTVHPDENIVAEVCGYEIRNRDLNTLNENGLLNDEIINAYLKLIQEYGRHMNVPVLSYSTYFFPRLVAGSHFAVKGHTKKVDVFQMKLLVIPIHVVMPPSNHWALVVVDIASKVVSYYDSAKLSSGRTYLQTVLDYLQSEACAKDVPFSETEWSKRTAKDIPTQNNGHDCGVFMCHYVLNLVRGVDMSFTQASIPTFREEMKAAILRASLIEGSKDVVEVPETVIAAPRRKKVLCESTGLSPVKKKTRTIKSTAEGVVRVPKFRRAVEEGKHTTTNGVYLITSAHVSQRSPVFSKGHNSQGAVMAVCALAVAARRGPVLSADDLDSVLYTAHHLFMEMSLSPMQLPEKVAMNGEVLSLSYLPAFQGTYHESSRLREFADKLLSFLETCNRDEPFGFVLTGHSRCVSFWPKNNSKFVLFNSHSVDANNYIATVVKRGAARLFECISAEALASIAFISDVSDGAVWSVVKVTL